MINSADLDFYKSAIVAGKTVELRETELPVFLGGARKRSGRSSIASAEDKIINREKVLARARRSVRNLVNANPDCNKFLTLTFKENITDLSQAYKSLHYFLKKIKRYIMPNMKFIAVPEFQKRGAVHYHLICNLQYIHWKMLEKLWGQGYIKINKIDEVDNVGAYVSKYINKDFADERLVGRKCYYCSKNLTKPTKITSETQLRLLEKQLGNADVIRIHTFEYENDYSGHTTVTRILLKEPINIEKITCLTPIPARVWKLFQRGVSFV